MFTASIMFSQNNRCLVAKPSTNNLRVGRHSSSYGPCVSQNIRLRSTVNKWKNKMMQHRRIRKLNEKNRWKQSMMMTSSGYTPNKRRKAHRSDGDVYCKDILTNIDRVNEMNSFKARMFLLQKVRYSQHRNFPEDLVGPCILYQPRKRALFQESVRVIAAAATAAYASRCH
jgi:hypothetical protein